MICLQHHTHILLIHHNRTTSALQRLYTHQFINELIKVISATSQPVYHAKVKNGAIISDYILFVVVVVFATITQWKRTEDSRSQCIRRPINLSQQQCNNRANRCHSERCCLMLATATYSKHHHSTLTRGRRVKVKLIYMH